MRTRARESGCRSVRASRTFGRRALCAALGALALAIASPALAARPFVTIRDDGYLSTTKLDEPTDDPLTERFLAAYKASGAPVPEILSVWTTFDFGGSPMPTYFLHVANDVSGVGLDMIDDGKTIFRKLEAPLRSVLVHNNVLRLPERAARYHMSTEGLPELLFLLEALHNWGATLRVPGDDPNALLGNPPHWSFWLDAGGSPAGGNVWKDNGDGTFTAAPAKRVTLRCSPLDLYVMGLIPASEVPPFGLLESPEPPEGALDWRDGSKLSNNAFPWTEDRPLTVKARRRVIRIEDIIAKNGPREPPFGKAPQEWTLGIALMVGPKATDAEVRAAESLFEPIAAALAPAFHESTWGKGTLRVVSFAPEAKKPEKAGELPEAKVAPRASGCAHGCAVEAEERRPVGLMAALAIAATALLRRRSARERLERSPP